MKKNFDTRTTKYVRRKKSIVFFCFQFQILLIIPNANSEFKHSVGVQLTTHFNQQKCEKNFETRTTKYVERKNKVLFFLFSISKSVD